MVQHIGLSGESKKIEVTLLVMRLFFGLSGKSRGCASDVRTTAESRLKATAKKRLFKFGLTAKPWVLPKPGREIISLHPY
ncbi:MAG: hypothetical protein HQL68_00120 [Magnetococcales bacterium]|nr:hypothetical protein [Magnetococcales bacterium]